MKPAKIIIIIFLLIFIHSSCNNQTVPVSDTTETESETVKEIEPVAYYTEDGRRIITIGTWYDRYYVSKHKDITDDPQLSDNNSSTKRLDRVREIEEKYNVELRYVNLTYDGVRESINASALAGVPEVDIYEVDMKFGIPAVLNGYAVSLEEMGLRDTDVFTTQKVFKYLSLMEQEQTYLFTPIGTGAVNAYVLAFNMDLINGAGLENPQDLYDRGEWTWDKWQEYLKVLTRDTNGDGKTDIYGYSGYWGQLLSNLLLSNGTSIAGGKTETLSSPETLEVLDFIYTIYNYDKTARPWDSSNWDINNELYAAGLSGFWIGADWLFGEQGGSELPFEIGVVPWPCGPSGDLETNRHSLPQNNWYFIPKGIEDPRLVYDVIFDWINWYDGDTELGINQEWSRNLYMNERNFEYARFMDSRPGFDLWEGLDVGFNLTEMMDGEENPVTVVEYYKTLYQEALDSYFN